MIINSYSSFPQYLGCHVNGIAQGQVCVCVCVCACACVCVCVCLYMPAFFRSEDICITQIW